MQMLMCCKRLATILIASTMHTYSPEVDFTSKLRLALLNAWKVVYHGDAVVESVWTTTAYSSDMRLKEHTGQG